MSGSLDRRTDQTDADLCGRWMSGTGNRRICPAGFPDEREWRHVLSLRCSKAAHPSLRVVFIPLLIHFKKIMPELFDDIAYDETFDKENYASLIIN